MLPAVKTIKNDKASKMFSWSCYCTDRISMYAIHLLTPNYYLNPFVVTTIWRWKYHQILSKYSKLGHKWLRVILRAIHVAFRIICIEKIWPEKSTKHSRIVWPWKIVNDSYFYIICLCIDHSNIRVRIVQKTIQKRAKIFGVIFIW